MTEEYIKLQFITPAIAVVEAKDYSHSDSHLLQQTMDYAQKLELPFAYSSNVGGFADHDYLIGTKCQFGMDKFPKEDELTACHKEESGMKRKNLYLADRNILVD